MKLSSTSHDPAMVIVDEVVVPKVNKTGTVAEEDPRKREYTKKGENLDSSREEGKGDKDREK